MATALTQPSGTQVLQVYGVVPGQNHKVGIYAAADLDNDVTVNGEASVIKRAWKQVRAKLTAKGLNPDALNDVTEWPYAYNALRWIVVYEFMYMDHQQKLRNTSYQSETVEQFFNRWNTVKMTIRENLYDGLGISIDRYTSLGNLVSTIQYD